MMTKKIPLYNKHGDIVDYTFVDVDDFDRLSMFKWYSMGGYVVRFDYSSGKKICVLLHREVLNLVDSEIVVDHINKNTFDNRKSNLRKANRTQNGANAKISKRNKSGFKGVTSSRRIDKPWRATIVYNYKQIFLGNFKTKEEAASAYNRAAIKYFGEFASLNDI